MEEHRLRASELSVSEIGLGCMSLGKAGAEAERIVARALELGVTLFDTADLYDHGANEELLGRALGARRRDVVVATKVGNRWREDGDGWDWDPSPEYITRCVHESLRRLGTDYIDLYQLHGGTIDDPIDDTIAAFDDLQQQGLIRAYGISSIRPNVIREWAARSSMVSVMMQYSLLDRRPEETALQLLSERGIGVIVRGPVAKGLLADKPARSYLEHDAAAVSSARGALDQLSSERRTRGQTALRFVLAAPGVVTAVPGASGVRQLEENVGAAASEPLTAAQCDQLRGSVAPLRYTQHR